MRVRKILLFAAMGAFCVLFAALVGFTGSMLFVSAEEADEEQPPCVHSWDAGAVTTEPSCTVNGIRRRVRRPASCEVFVRAVCMRSMK